MSYGCVHGKLSYISPQGGSLPVVDLVKTEGTPLYIYDIDDVLMRVKKLKASFQRPIEIHYAMKANFHPYLLKVLARAGVGTDVVSGGELKWALENGHRPEHIVFSGVGKTREEIRLALENEVGQINVESPEELRRIGEIARSLHKKIRVAFRMNPDVSAATHPYIQTGFRENKFGMDLSFMPELKEILSNYPAELELYGLTLHIGSQIRDLKALKEAVLKTKTVWKALQAEGYDLKTFDVGGGLGIDYHDFAAADEMKLIEDYGREMSEALADLGEIRLLLEPGRILVARMGLLVGEVQYIKKTPYKNFAVLNTGMHHLMRPALYQAHHRLLPLTESAEELETYDVVGPICESSDVIGHDRRLPRLKAGDFLAVADAGAYGYSMASRYNLHEMPKEICIHEGKVQTFN
jgi:diaminopimelate decarboxylase